MPTETPLAELASLMTQLTPGDGIHPTAVQGVSILRASTPNNLVHDVHEPAVCVIVQGSKRVLLADEVLRYDPSRYLVASVDLPVSAEVLQASADKPYLCLRMSLDPRDVAETVLQSGLSAVRKPTSRGLFLSETTPPLLDAVLRLVRLLRAPDDIALLAPLTKREILYRLLTGPEGVRLHQIASPDSHSQRVARAIAWLKENFHLPMKVDEMARQVNMSTSSLHHHFKAVTAMSPLQYQKQLRLQEARKLMLGAGLDAATASWRVGYESSSQFSREYRRMFSESPGRDAQRLRGLQ
jgi:AraC-like DNA-binding protein